MEILTVGILKQHCRYDCNDLDYTAEACCMDAEKYIQEIMGKTFDDIRKEYGEIPKSIEFACIQLAGSMFEDAMIQTPSCMRGVPHTIGLLVNPYSKQEGLLIRIENVSNKIKERL